MKKILIRWFNENKHKKWLRTSKVLVASTALGIILQMWYSFVDSLNDEVAIYLLTLMFLALVFLTAWYKAECEITLAKQRQIDEAVKSLIAQMLSDQKAMEAASQRIVQSVILWKIKEAAYLEEAKLKALKASIPTDETGKVCTSKSDLEYILGNLEKLDKNRISVEKLPLYLKLATILHTDCYPRVTKFFTSIEKTSIEKTSTKKNTNVEKKR